eukprot:CAMPEP_0174243536 /NCGR_PEP_ID=MMETSP0417-20130205/32026_1 /TAXON_ID=242541 /ORGANISM="Mayorella sp, Strain BSH-02190019" /LENGTH=241 /DNA_ID=CAMNT_0015323071 /DNA_START=91 /DNA_END=816 /DNA_ORIENTATION=-
MSVFGKRKAQEQELPSGSRRLLNLGSFSLAPLPWHPRALEPVMSAPAILSHYEEQRRHLHELNSIVTETPLAHCSLLELVLQAAHLHSQQEKGSVLSRVCLNAAQLWNHSFFFDSLCPPSVDPSSGRVRLVSPPPCLRVLLDRHFGGVHAFRERFTAAALEHFGSGWLWLVQAPRDGALLLLSTHDAENPLPRGLKPLLSLDLWEHAYLHDFGGDRTLYVSAFWLVVNWARVEERLHAPCL